MTAPTALLLALGDVIQDSYGNAAVVVRIERGGHGPLYSIMQTCGSDRGRVGSAPSRLLPVVDPAVVEAARAIVRAEARRQGWRWNASGITR